MLFFSVISFCCCSHAPFCRLICQPERGIFHHLECESVWSLVWTVLPGVRWCALSALGGPLHWSILSWHLADHPESDRLFWTVIHAERAPDLSLPTRSPRPHPSKLAPEVVILLLPVEWSSLSISWALNQLNTCFKCGFDVALVIVSYLNGIINSR